MLLNPEKDFAPSVELRRDPWIRVERRVESAAKFGEIHKDSLRVGIVLGKHPLVRQRPPAEKLFRRVRDGWLASGHPFTAIGMRVFATLAAAGAASIICCVCCCCCRPWRMD